MHMPTSADAVINIKYASKPETKLSEGLTVSRRTRYARADNHHSRARVILVPHGDLRTGLCARHICDSPSTAVSILQDSSHPGNVI
jgi:hypothetical protein